MLLEGKSFTAAGKTRGQLEKEIHDCYVPRYYLKMTVSVGQKTQTQFYYVRGEVKQPARQIYISRITVLKAIASAGDFTDFARKNAVLLTRADGRKVVINAKKALKDPTLDLEVLPGDDIYVPRRNPIW
jgi:polysaccharide export outer membrane protein